MVTCNFMLFLLLCLFLISLVMFWTHWNSHFGCFSDVGPLCKLHKISKTATSFDSWIRACTLIQNANLFICSKQAQRFLVKLAMFMYMWFGAFLVHDRKLERSNRVWFYATDIKSKICNGMNFDSYSIREFHFQR